jgi:hypothetical protein
MVEWQYAFAAGFLVALAARVHCRIISYPWTPALYFWAGVFCLLNWVLG